MGDTDQALIRARLRSALPSFFRAYPVTYNLQAPGLVITCAPPHLGTSERECEPTFRLLGEAVDHTHSQSGSSPRTEADEYERYGRIEGIDIGTVYHKYYRRVFKWCLRMVRNRQDAEDLTQDAFVHVMRKIHTFRGEAKLSTWLYRVVMNTVLMHIRSARPTYDSLDDEYEEKTLYLPVSENSLSYFEAHFDLERTISQLPAGFKMVLLLHDVEEYTHSEIAKIRGGTSGTSKSQLHKARRRLRAMLNDVHWTG